MLAALLVPVKSMGNAKQRLAEALDQPRRTQLAEAMLRDVLTAASGVASRVDVFLVTGDVSAQSPGPRIRFPASLKTVAMKAKAAAIEMATAWCVDRDYDTTAVIPGDIPLVTSAELDAVFDAAPVEGALLVPAYDRRGSNCVVRRPADLIPLRFGNDSFLPHCEAVRKTGKPLVILELPGIGLDVDRPHELDLVLQHGGDTHAQRLLRSWGCAGRGEVAWEATG